MDSKPTIVFIPGAWHSPDSFQLARDALQARGWETEAVAFPTVGAEPPTKGVPDDAAAVRKVLEALAEQGKQIVLVVHSYGGVVGAQAVRGLGYKQRQKEGKVGGIITYLYLSAFVVPVGQSLLKMLGGNWLPWMRVEVNSAAEARLYRGSANYPHRASAFTQTHQKKFSTTICLPMSRKRQLALWNMNASVRLQMRLTTSLGKICTACTLSARKTKPSLQLCRNTWPVFSDPTR